VAQETFLQVYRCLEKFQGRSSLLTWIFGIANNQVYRQFRRKSATLVAPEDVELWADSDTAVSVDRRVDANRILANCGRVLTEKVSPAQREVFYLHYGENQSTRAIAKKVGKSTQAIKISLFRTRRILSERAARDLDTVLH
jgi:RNA polymerase sigma-70 factor (ECF subfamily)